MNEQSLQRAKQFVRFLEKVEDVIPAIQPLYNSAFEVLIFCIISLRTKDPVAYAAADRLFTLANTPHAMARLSIQQISQSIYPAGFYQRKAEQILAIAQDLDAKGLDQPPASKEALLAYAGVGLKTANLTLSRGFGLPAICVDIHVHRIANRMQVVATSTPDETEAALSQLLDQTYWVKINPLLVYLGQNYCGVKTKCAICPVHDMCMKNS